MIRRPSYYKKFKCISKNCTDSCCTDWEIDIDEDTLDFYKNVKGDFAGRLKDNIFIPGKDDEEIPHFIQTKDERCPFLNECNLCDIFINLGEEHLSQICTHHPRYYDWFLNGEEQGLGLCCEEAARLILTDDSENDFEVIQTENQEEIGDDEEYEVQQALENLLFEMRNEIFDILNNDNGLKMKINELWDKSVVYQNKYDEILFSESFETANDKVFTDIFFFFFTLCKLIDFYMNLEINNMDWWRKLKDLKENLHEVIEIKSEFNEYYKDSFEQYINLLKYFVYRYFMKSREDDNVTGKIKFSLISTLMIYVLDVYNYKFYGRLTLTDQINICKLYSKEVEYDEDNESAVENCTLF